jgi:hypothetical protein
MQREVPVKSAFLAIHAVPFIDPDAEPVNVNKDPIRPLDMDNLLHPSRTVGNAALVGYPSAPIDVLAA